MSAFGGKSDVAGGWNIQESAAGYQVFWAFERLGISDAMKAKLKAQAAPAQVVKPWLQARLSSECFSPMY